MLSLHGTKKRSLHNITQFIGCRRIVFSFSLRLSQLLTYKWRGVLFCFSMLHVQERLGHKSILTTTIYTHIINFDADSYYTEVAQNTKQARNMLEAGFEYVTGEYADGGKIFRKPK